MFSQTEKRNQILSSVTFNLNVLQLMHNKPNLILSDKAKEKILQYNWSDDLSEIEKILENAVQNCQNNTILAENIQLEYAVGEIEVPIGLKLETVERKYILQTLFFVEQNRTRAAEVLGISIRTLRNKINQYRIEGHL